jgi:co-chaperonin GroES (HSP10)
MTVEATKAKTKFALKPQGARILVKEDGFKYEGLIEVPDSAKRRPTTGWIVDVGPDGDKSLIGKHILYAQFSGTGINLRHQPAFRVLSVDEVLLIIEGEVEVEEVSA